VSIDDDGKYSVDNLPVIIYNNASAADGLEFPFNLPVYGSNDSCTFSGVTTLPSPSLSKRCSLSVIGTNTSLIHGP